MSSGLRLAYHNTRICRLLVSTPTQTFMCAWYALNIPCWVVCWQCQQPLCACWRDGLKMNFSLGVRQQRCCSAVCSAGGLVSAWCSSTHLLSHVCVCLEVREAQYRSGVQRSDCERVWRKGKGVGETGGCGSVSGRCLGCAPCIGGEHLCVEAAALLL
jgi:hypothetical protein